jgi:hypothetical protein
METHLSQIYFFLLQVFMNEALKPEVANVQ